MNDDLDTSLARQLQASPEPDDAGFSLRVMAALPAQVPLHRRRDLRWIQFTQWTFGSLAACGAAAMFTTGSGTPDLSHTLAGLALLGLALYWSLPSRWNRP